MIDEFASGGRGSGEGDVDCAVATVEESVTKRNREKKVVRDKRGEKVQLLDCSRNYAEGTEEEGELLLFGDVERK